MAEELSRMSGEENLGQGSGQCKGPEVAVSLAGSSNSKTSVAGAQGTHSRNEGSIIQSLEATLRV